MPFFIQSLLVVSPALSPKTGHEVQQLINTVVTGAFEQQCDFRLSVAHADGIGSTSYQLELSAEIQPRDALGIVPRVAETTLLLIKILASELGVSVRYYGTPKFPMLRLSGLTWYRVRCKLAEILSSFESTGAVELMIPCCDVRIRVATGCPLGSTGPHPVHLCNTVVRRRRTSFGEVVRIRTGRKLMSIVVPPDVNPSAVSDGAAFHTAPIVGLIPRRLLQFERCQLPLFNGY